MICISFSSLKMNSYPFDWRSPIGYLIAVSVQCAVAFYLLDYLASFVSISLGAFLISNSINGFLRDDLQLINKKAEDKKAEDKKFKPEPFFEFIRTYAEIKQLSCFINFSNTV